jgi:phage-related protein
VLAVNGTNILTINLGSEGDITIDTEALEAYKGTTLKNRLVSGNYDKFTLQKGENTISWTGNVTQIDIENYSRWI